VGSPLIGMRELPDRYDATRDDEPPSAPADDRADEPVVRGPAG
jgi:hypothetical protein